jgi:hypothetical protein
MGSIARNLDSTADESAEKVTFRQGQRSMEMYCGVDNSNPIDVIMQAYSSANGRSSDHRIKSRGFF